MKKIKIFIKKHFSSFAYFYSYLKNKVFLGFTSNIMVSVLDSLGLVMFFPLLKVIGEEGNLDSEDLGKLHYLIDFIEYLGIPLTVMGVLSVMLVFFMLKGVVIYISRVYIIFLQEGFVRDIRLNLIKGLNNMSFKSFISSDVGRIQNTISGEVDRVSLGFRYYFETFQQATMVFVYLGFAFVIDYQFAILVTIGGVLTNFLYKNIYKHTESASRRLTSHNSLFQGQVIQYVGNFKYLKSTGKANIYAEKLRETVFKIEVARRKIGRLASISFAIREPILVGVIAVVIVVQVKFFNGAMGGIVISLLLFFRALQSMTIMQGQWNRFLESSGSLENMQDFQKSLLSSKEANGDIIMDPFKTAIVFDNVKFSYGETTILNNINIQIQKNQSYAFVGESGSGKTTLVNMIAGLVPEDVGRIYVDSIPLKDLKKESYQKRIGYVSQDAVIFNDTIYNNVTFWAEPTPENVNRFKQSIKQAALVEFLDALPEKEQTQLGNNGINLSGGQKQRISIARELYKDIDILILDEATSALDSETENAIQKSIDALQGKYTILIVAHRLSTIRNTNKIVFMDKGEIIDIDNFEGLTERQKRFRKMVELQEL